MAKELGITAADVKARVDQLHEMNPMLGHRGCRLAVTYPEILEMQVTAITEAVIACKQKKIDAQAEIMIPLVGTARELAMLAEQVRQTMADVQEKKKYTGKLDILVGTMIEIPRAALTADEIAEIADFFSFGTNDLTQMTFGFSRDDINTFLPDYLRQEILPRDPFQSLDTARRRPIGGDGCHARAAARRTSSSAASAASTAATRTRSSSATRWVWITSPAARSACRSPGWRRPKRL